MLHLSSRVGRHQRPAAQALVVPCSALLQVQEHVQWHGTLGVCSTTATSTTVLSTQDWPIRTPDFSFCFVMDQCEPMVTPCTHHRINTCSVDRIDPRVTLIAPRRKISPVNLYAGIVSARRRVTIQINARWARRAALSSTPQQIRAGAAGVPARAHIIKRQIDGARAAGFDQRRRKATAGRRHLTCGARAAPAGTSIRGGDPDGRSSKPPPLDPGRRPRS